MAELQSKPARFGILVSALQERQELSFVRTLISAGPTGDVHMQHYSGIGAVAAGTFIAVSLFSGTAYIITSALH